MKQHRVIISFGEDEWLPVLVDIGHNLKHENTFLCESEMVMDNPDHYILHTVFMRNEKRCDIIITYSDKTLIRGFLYYNNKEFVVNDSRTYASLQVGEWCYDNITVVRLLENPFLESP